MTEVWKLIEATDNYYVSNLGRIKVDVEIRKPTVEKKSGKMAIGIKYRNGIRRTPAVHVLVARAFIPNPKNHRHIIHINGDKSDNMAINLKWVSAKYTANKALADGKLTTKLKEDDVVTIKELLSRNVGIDVIASRFNTTRLAISNIKRGKTWRYVK